MSKLNRIKEVLDEKNMTQQWLSDQLGVSFQAINALCQNTSQPSLKRLQEIASILNVDIRDLIVSTKMDYNLSEKLKEMSRDLDEISKKIKE